MEDRNLRLAVSAIAFTCTLSLKMAWGQYAPVTPVPIAPIVQPNDFRFPPPRQPSRSKASRQTVRGDASSSLDAARRRSLELPDPTVSRNPYEEVSPKLPSIGAAQSPRATQQGSSGEANWQGRELNRGREVMSHLEKQIDQGIRQERAQMNEIHQHLNALQESLKRQREASVTVEVTPAPTLPRSPNSTGPPAVAPATPPPLPSPSELPAPPPTALPQRPSVSDPPALQGPSELPVPPPETAPSPEPVEPAPAVNSMPARSMPNGSLATSSSVDRVSMADSLYAANNLPFALQIYREVAPTADPRQAVWIKYQIANSLRRLNDLDEAEKHYREVASLDSPDWIVQSARWWLSNRQQLKDIDERLKRINAALAEPTTRSARGSR